MLLPVSTIQITRVNWGYFQLTQYLQDDTKFDKVEDLFPTFVSTNFFAQSHAYLGERVENRKSGWELDTSYGRHLLVDISKLETRTYALEDFFGRLHCTINEQVDYSYGYADLPANVIDYQKQIMELLTSLLTPGTIIYEIFVDDDRKHHEGHGPHIWDYFKSFIAIDRANKFLYRIEHGID